MIYFDSFTWTTGDAETFAADKSSARVSVRMSGGRKSLEERSIATSGRDEAQMRRSTKDKSYRRSCTSSVGESHRVDPRGAHVPRASTACCKPRRRRIRMCSARRRHRHHHHRPGISSAAMQSPTTNN